MPHVLAMAAVQVRNPIVVFVLVKTYDDAFHRRALLRPEPEHSRALP